MNILMLNGSHLSPRISISLGITIKALFTLKRLRLRQRMGSMATNDGVHSLRLHLMAKIKGKP